MVNPLQLKSAEELHFFWYLSELKECGYIDEFYYEPEPIKLSGTIEVEVEKQLKTKVKIEKKTLLQGHEYTMDFIIYWNPNAFGCFHNNDDTRFPFYATLENEVSISYVDVKGSWNMHNMNRLFAVNQKWVYDKFGIYIQKIVPEKLFKQTFTPRRFLTTDKSGKLRKIKHDCVLLEEYTAKEK